MKDLSQILLAPGKVGGHFCFSEMPSTCYNSVDEVTPGVLLVTYDRQEFDDAGNLSDAVVGTFFEVRKVR